MAVPGFFKLRLNSSGIGALLKSGAVSADMARRAAGMKSRLSNEGGAEWVTRSGFSKDRAWSMVVARNQAAREAAANGALHRAIDGGR